jgi:hypothetical protein
MTGFACKIITRIAHWRMGGGGGAQRKAKSRIGRLFPGEEIR